MDENVHLHQSGKTLPMLEVWWAARSSISGLKEDAGSRSGETEFRHRRPVEVTEGQKRTHQARMTPSRIHEPEEQSGLAQRSCLIFSLAGVTPTPICLRAVLRVRRWTRSCAGHKGFCGSRGTLVNGSVSATFGPVGLDGPGYKLGQSGVDFHTVCRAPSSQAPEESNTEPLEKRLPRTSMGCHSLCQDDKQATDVHARDRRMLDVE